MLLLQSKNLRIVALVTECIFPETEASQEQSEEGSRNVREIAENELRETLEREMDPVSYKNHGSFYLRIGAVSMFSYRLLPLFKCFYGRKIERLCQSFWNRCDDLCSLGVWPVFRDVKQPVLQRHYVGRSTVFTHALHVLPNVLCLLKLQG